MRFIQAEPNGLPLIGDVLADFLEDVADLYQDVV